MVSRRVELEVVLGTPVPGYDPQLPESPVSLDDHQLIPEQLEVLEQHVLPVGNDFLPVVGFGPLDARFDQPEILRVFVGQNEEVFSQVAERVLVTALARKKEPKARVGSIGGKETILVRDGLLAGDHEEPLRFRLVDVNGEGLVFFLVDEHVLAGRRPQLVAEDTVPAKRLKVLLRVEECLVVVGPGQISGHRFDDVVEELPGVEILETNRVDAAALRIGGVGEDVLSGADRQGTDREVVVTFGQEIAVEHHLLVAGKRVLLPAVERVFLPLLETRVVEVVLPSIGNGAVVRLDASLDLQKKRLLELCRVGHDRLGIGVLRLEVANHLWVLSILHPVVRVDADVSVLFQLLGELSGDRGAGLSGHEGAPLSRGLEDETALRHRFDLFGA